jgi:hypothetical protein
MIKGDEAEMRRVRVPIMSIWFLLMMLLTAACTGASTPATPTEALIIPSTGTEMPEVGEAPTPEATIDFARDLEDFNPDNFDHPTQFDNPWFPLRPGTQFTFAGIAVEGGRALPHNIIFTVTDLTKEIAGVQTIVAWVLDYSQDELVEAELAFYAQDNDGNVWFLGEYPEVYERGKFVEAPAWITGYKGATAGIVMKADPQVGLPSYSMGWGPAVNWTDRAQVVELGMRVCVPFGCYEDVLLIEEFSREEEGAFQLKYYAPDVGNIRVGWRGADATKEELELVDLVQLEGQALAEVRQAALDLEERAYAISKEVYDQTTPAEQLLDME